MKLCIAHIVTPHTGISLEAMTAAGYDRTARIYMGEYRQSDVLPTTSKMEIYNMVSIGGAMLPVSLQSAGKTMDHEGKSKININDKNVVDLKGRKDVSDVTVEETASKNTGGKNSTVYFRINCDFNLGKQLAVSCYSECR